MDSCGEGMRVRVRVGGTQGGFAAWQEPRPPGWGVAAWQVRSRSRLGGLAGAAPSRLGGGGVAGVADQLQHDLMDRFDRFHADQFLVQTRVEVGESIGVDAQLMQDRGVQSFDVEGIVDGC